MQNPSLPPLLSTFFDGADRDFAFGARFSSTGAAAGAAPPPRPTICTSAHEL